MTEKQYPKATARQEYLDTYQLVSTVGREQLARDYLTEWGEEATTDEELADSYLARSPFDDTPEIRRAAVRAVIDVLTGLEADPPE